MNQVQIIVKVGARIKVGGNRYHNRQEFVVIANQIRGNKFYFHQNGRLVEVYGDVEIL